MRKGFLCILSILFLTLFYHSDLRAETRGKSKKEAEKNVKQAIPKDDTEDHIRCDEETYKKYNELKPKYLDVQRKIGEIDARLKMNENNLEKLKRMSDEEIDKDVRDENIKNIEDENSRLKSERKKLEEEGIEFYKIYEPFRHRCED